MMEAVFARKEDLQMLSSWCKDVPEFQKNLIPYMDRDDTAIVKLEKNSQLAGIALVKVKETQKSGTIWLHLNEEGKHNHQAIVQKSLEWLRQKGAKDYHLI
jgi:hypothetical protein